VRNKRKQSGFILLFAIALIPLVGIGILVATQHSRYLIQETRYRALQAEARNIVCSAEAWIDLHPEQIRSAPPGQVLEPDLSGLEIARGSCRVELLSATPSARTIEITAVSKSGTKSWKETRTIVLSR